MKIFLVYINGYLVCIDIINCTISWHYKFTNFEAKEIFSIEFGDFVSCPKINYEQVLFITFILFFNS